MNNTTTNTKAGPAEFRMSRQADGSWEVSISTPEPRPINVRFSVQTGRYKKVEN